jgi:nucleoredoxin
VSSDNSVEAFNGYYAKMPFVALPSQSTAAIKNSLAQKLQIQGIPTLIILDAKTGNFITDSARNEVTRVGDDKEKGKELIASWKAKESVPIEEAAAHRQLQQGPGGIMGIIFWFLKNPVYIFGALYLLRKLMRKIRQLQGEEEPQEL